MSKIFPCKTQETELTKKKKDYNTYYCKRKVRVVLTISTELDVVYWWTNEDDLMSLVSGPWFDLEDVFFAIFITTKETDNRMQL